MEIDEAGGDDAAGGVDLSPAGLGNLSAEVNYAAAAHGDVAHLIDAGEGVHNASVSDDVVNFHVDSPSG